MLPLPPEEKRRQRIGLALLILGSGIGFVITALAIVGSAFQQGVCGAMCLGAVFAFPMAAVYMTVPRMLDRYDPEPWYALIGCLIWGGTAATGFSLIFNELIGGIASASLGERAGEIAGAVISAPIFEELFKGIGVFGVFYFLRREFDGVVDGIIYATFIALGFAATENVLYYGRAAAEGSLGGVFVARGILFPWGHPVYTSMTGIGFGLAREAKSPAMRALAPFAGYAGAVFLHAVWNGSATFSEAIGIGPFLCSLLIWFLFVGAFIVLVIVLVRRRGRTIRAFLQDEVALGNLSPAEVDLVCDAFGVWKARMRHGKLGVNFVRAAARLALSKWHFTRAQGAGKQTVSADFIVPLRQRLHALRAEYRGRA